MIFFKYLFYRVTSFYLKVETGDIDSAAITGSAIVTLVQLTILWIFINTAGIMYPEFNKFLQSFPDSKLRNPVVILPSVGVLFFNYYYFEKVEPYKKLKSIWFNEAPNVRRKRTIFLIIGILGSFIISIILSIHRTS